MVGRGERHGVVAGRSDDDRDEAERLLEQCNRDEGLDLPVSVDPALAEGSATTQFRCYDGGALIGFAWLPPEPEPEACLMVHPAYRRRGLGKALLEAVRAEVRRRGLTAFPLVCDEASPSGTGFLAAVGARYRSSEYRLELDKAAIDRTPPRHEALRLRRADGGDIAILGRLLAAVFDTPEDDAREDVERRLREPGRHYYLAELSGEPIGTLRLGAWEQAAGVTAFGVLPEYRGRGYGRQILRDGVDLLLADGWERILIEVATDNAGALGLYRSCGFALATAYGFYDLPA